MGLSGAYLVIETVLDPDYGQIGVRPRVLNFVTSSEPHPEKAIWKKAGHMY